MPSLSSWKCGALAAVLLGILPAAAAAAPQDPAPSPPAQTPHDQHDQSTAEAGAGAPVLKIAGFSDFDYAARRHIDGPRGFTEGQFVLHMTSVLSPRVTFFGELSLTARADAGSGSPPVTGFNTEVERMILRFDHSDLLKVSFGRYHTPINYWNTAFHHGQWLQTTISRPEMIQFGGRFLPVHFVGALVEGSAPTGGWNLNYKAGVGNGRGSVISRAGDAGDVNDSRAWLVNVFSKPDRPYGLEFGGSTYVDTITLSTARTFDEQIVSGYGAWQKENPEIIAEYASVRHLETIGGASATWNHAYYIQAAYRLPRFDRLWKPYYRFEHVGIAAKDVVFQGVLPIDGSTLGVRYDASQFAAIKGEFRTWRRDPANPRNYGAFFQICFTF